MKVNLSWYDWIVVNSSAGKDSQAMLDEIASQARAAGILDRVVVVHADLSRVEWRGTRELAERQARHYGLRFEVVKRSQGDLLDHVRKRGKWPSSTTRYCTSDHKRGQVGTLFTKLAKETGNIGRRVRVLNCMGIRSQESRPRSKLLPFRLDRRYSNTKRTVHVFLPIHSWSLEDVWARIKASGVEHHYAYDLGMPRLSCCFCVFAPRKALILAGKHNPELLAEYVQVEREIGHSFRKELPIVEVQKAVQCNEETSDIKTWEM